MYKKPLMMKIVGLNVDTVFYLIKIKGSWVFYKKAVDDFIYMMYVLFPDIMRQADKYQFENKYQLANWLYNYGEAVKPCETHIFYNK